MKNVKINISKLGAIRNSEIEVCPFLIFTGESGLGKSYAAFLSHYIFTLLGTTRLSHFFDSHPIEIKNLSKDNGKVIYEISADAIFNWINADAINYIGYMIGHSSFHGEIKIEWPAEIRKFSFTYHEEMVGLANNEEVVNKIRSENFTYNLYAVDNTESGIAKMYADAFQALIRAELSKSVLGEFLGFVNEYILPPSRGALMELNERPAFMSGMYNEFLNLKNNLFLPVKKANVPDPVLINHLKKLITGDIRQTSGNFTYITSDGILMPLTAAASSVKELAPFILLITKYNLKNSSILFEEPEAHLHPSRQNHIADLLGMAIRQGCFLQITTHSDFFIRRLNLLVKLYAIKNNSKTFDDLMAKFGISREALINPKNIRAYCLHRDENGFSKIEQLDVTSSSGIPFDSFQQAFIESLSIDDILNDLDEKQEMPF